MVLRRLALASTLTAVVSFAVDSVSSFSLGRRARACRAIPGRDDYRREEFWSGDGDSVDCGDLKLLYERISKTREILERADRACAENWRRGAGVQTAVVELEDGRVSQARLHGNTCAFGTSNGGVLVIDLVFGDVMDGYEGHDGEVTALDWDGTRLLTGGVDGVVCVYEPQNRGDDAPFELVDVTDEYDDDYEDDDDEERASLRDDGDVENILNFDKTSRGDADAAALARAPLYQALCEDLAPPSDDSIIISKTSSVTDAVRDLVYGDEDEAEEAIALQGHSSRVTGVRWCDGIVYSSSLDKQILAWNLTSRRGRVIATTKSPICCLAIADNLAIVGLLDGSVEAYDRETGEVAFEIVKAHDGAVRALHVDATADAPLDGRLLVTGGMDGVVKCYTIERVGGTLQPMPPSPQRVDYFSCDDYLEQRRRNRLGAHALRGHSGAVVAVQADETKLVSAATDGSVRVWCLRTGHQLYAIQGLSRKISSVHFDKHLLVCDGTEESIVVHDFSDPRARQLVDADNDD
ncbi:hypothetical protein CTAYLR_003922 [Chrysophaeum taylorii]|uniref:Uncharacterized protein n=1 Tax=Chrysophaeum taylorii TaxID=2483200 RepID=A0AAD7UB36_9STRA|nr:hypothetical protein CTAYLR_003922 [Chrysophaeum taylorii]